MRARSSDIPLLFRGDAGLPPGVPPASPLFQLQLRRGRTVTEALEHCRLITKIASDEDRDGDADLADLVEDATHLQSPTNPLVSLTSDLERAKRYAEAGRRDSARPYISAVIPRDANRVVDFRTRLTVTEKAVANKEIGLVGMVHRDEVRLRAYVDELTPSLEKLIATLPFQPAGVIIPRFGIADEDLRDVFSLDYHCANCNQPLPFYFRRYLGSDPNKIIISDVTDYNKPLFKPSVDSYLTDFLSGRPYVLDLMTETGVVCHCSNCGAYLRSSNPQRPDLVTVSVKHGKPDPTVALTNHHQVPLVAVLVGVHLLSGADEINLIARFLFGPGANRVDTSWPGIERMLRNFNWSQDAITEVLDHMLSQDPVVPQAATRELILVNCPSSRHYAIDTVSILRANFESGDVWSPSTAFDVEWHGFLETWSWN